MVASSVGWWERPTDYPWGSQLVDWWDLSSARSSVGLLETQRAEPLEQSSDESMVASMGHLMAQSTAPLMGVQ